MMPVGISHHQMSLPQEEESCSRQETLGSVRNSNSCQTVVIDCGWYSQKQLNLSSWKAGQSNMMCALSSLMAGQNLHFGSTLGFTNDRWYLRKLCPVRCLIHLPRSVLFSLRSSFAILGFGCGKKILVCRHVIECSHLAVHFSTVCLRASDLTAQVGSGRKGSGPSASCAEASFASLSASSFP